MATGTSFCAGCVYWHPATHGAHALSKSTVGYTSSKTLYANTCQATTNNIKVVGERGGILAQWLKPSCHHLGLSLVAILEVVGSIPAGDFFFVFGKSAVFLGRIAVWLGIFVHPKKRLMGILPWVRKTCPNAKNRAPGVGNYPFCSCRLGSRGRFLGRTGRFEPPHVT